MVLPGICGLNEDKGLRLPGPCATKRVEPTPDKPLRSWSGSLDQEECDQLVGEAESTLCETGRIGTKGTITSTGPRELTQDAE